jgi:hypothetical protein
MLDSLFGDVSSIQYNRLAKQGIILLDKSASSSKEALRKVIDELIT